jgi:iron-sulfur cluster assembly protein
MENQMASSRPRPKVMTLTEAAAARVAEIMTNSEKPAAALRVGVKNGGCAGMSYTMEWTDEIGKYDEVVDDKGVKLVIEPKAVLFLLGTEMDFETTKLSSGFVFRNPNQTSACGCGESVAIEPAKPEAIEAAHGGA